MSRCTDLLLFFFSFSLICLNYFRRCKTVKFINGPQLSVFRFKLMDLNRLDYSKIPLSALKKATQNILSAGLNQPKVIPNKDGLPRDWRGLAHLMGLNGVETGWIAASPDPLLALLNFWSKSGNLCMLQDYLRVIDRYDILDDTRQLFESNSLEYLERLNKINTPTTNISLESDKMILTADDLIRLERGMEPQIYDAYILYAEEDAEFASEIVQTMESKYSLKLCVRDRDLIGGVQFEHDAITKLIAERCRRLVVIVSSNFLKSKANKFFVTFAQALGIDIRERKVIPILYERCDVPPELSYYFLLDYNRAGKLWNFWEKLRDSIQGPEMQAIKSRVTTTESTPEDYWITRTHFEMEKEETGSSAVMEPEPLKVQNKKKNVYKIIKSSFAKTRKNGNEGFSKESNSLLANLKSFVSSENILFDNLENSENSSSFEGKEENLESKKVKKKKWFKKNLNALLS